MSQPTIILRRDKDDLYIYHLGYCSDKGTYNHNAYNHVCSFHYDNLWDIFGEAWAQHLRCVLEPGDSMIIELTIKQGGSQP